MTVKDSLQGLRAGGKLPKASLHRLGAGVEQTPDVLPLGKLGMARRAPFGEHVGELGLSDPGAWGHALGLYFSGIVHGFSMHNCCAFLKLFLRLFMILLLDYELLTNTMPSREKCAKSYMHPSKRLHAGSGSVADAGV